MTILSLDISFVVRELTFEVGEQKILLQEEREFSLFFVLDGVSSPIREEGFRSSYPFISPSYLKLRHSQ